MSKTAAGFFTWGARCSRYSLRLRRDCRAVSDIAAGVDIPLDLLAGLVEIGDGELASAGEAG